MSVNLWKPVGKPKAKKKLGTTSKKLQVKKAKPKPTKAETFKKRYGMRWVKIKFDNLTAARNAIACSLTALNGVKCLIVGDEPVIEYVAIRNIVAVGPKFLFHAPSDGTSGKTCDCSNPDCYEESPVPSDFKAVELQ